MKLLVLAATAFEIQPFCRVYPHADICISGIGSAQTTYALLHKLREKKYDAVFQCGVAGTNDKELALGSAVWITRDRFADLGAHEHGGFQSVEQLGLANAHSFPYTNGWLENPHHFELPATVSPVSGATVNTLIEDAAWIERMYAHEKPQTESMEGAALHYVCLMENIPFLQIRGVSNKVGERNKATWKLAEAIQSSNECLIQLYKYHQA